jgi:hypothetical protein
MTAKLSTSTFALATIFFLTPALAADLGGSKDPTSADYVAPDRVNWTGLWLGALGGYQINTNELSYHDHDDKGEYANDWKAGIDGLGSQGFMGELAIGFDKQLGDNFFVGVFAGANLDNSEWKAGLSSQNTIPGYDYSAEVSFEKEWGGVLGGRVGFIHGKTSFALGGGWAFGEMSKVHGSASAFGHTESGDLFKDQDTDLSGWFIQGDIEHALGGGLFAVGTARYTDYGSMTLYSESDGKDSIGLELDRDEIAALAGLKYKFGFGN